jgi:hypothetical protein
VGLLQKLLGRRSEDSGDETAAAPAAPSTTEPPTSEPDDEPQQTSGVLGDAAPLPDTAEPVASVPAQTTTVPIDITETTETPEPTVDEEAESTTSVEPVSDYFLPERPRRELLDLEPPPQPEPEPDASATSLPLDVSGSPRAALRNCGVTVPHMQQIVQRGDVRLWAFGVRGDEALGWWLQIRQVHEKTGWLPVLLGPADDWLDNGEGVLHEGDDELERMSEIDAETLLHDKGAEAGEPPRGVPILPTRGDSDFAVPKADGLLGLVEAEHSWQIPALLPWKGSTNWELYGAEHASVLRRWHERNEVELVSMTWDILELYVPNPPTSDDDVLEVAQEVYAYCPDLLAAGVPTLDDLAVHMVRSRAWYFRWT